MVVELSFVMGFRELTRQNYRRYLSKYLFNTHCETSVQIIIPEPICVNRTTDLAVDFSG